MKTIKLAAGTPLPIDIVTESIAILAIKRAGKSTTARRLVEQLYYAGQQCVVVDPKGDWWGLLYGRDGVTPGLPFVVLGGQHGHVPLTGDFQKTGELVARLAAVERVNLVIDLSEPRKHEVTKFMTFFLEALYRLKAKDEYRTPMMLCIDEADAIAPQRAISTEGKLEPRMLGAAEDIVRRGGQRGIGVALITQRAAVLNKNVLTQCGILIALRTVADIDIDAVDSWVEKHGTPEQRDTCIGSLPSLPTGTAWLWSSHFPDPAYTGTAFAGIFKKVEILLPDTFDSSKTPKVGEKPVIPKNAADVDLVAFQREMAETIEKAKSEDPKELHRRIRELQEQVRKGGVAAPPPPDTRPEVQELRKSFKQMQDANAQSERELRKVIAGLDKRLAQITELAAPRGNLTDAGQKYRAASVKPVNQAPEYHKNVISPVAPRPSRPPAAHNGDAPMSQMQRAMMIALAQHPSGLTKAQVLLHTGYASSGSTSAAFAELSRNGWATSPTANGLRITDSGLGALGDFDPLPLGRELREYLLTGDKLSTMEKAILRVLSEDYPEPVGKGVVLERAKYASSGSTSAAFARLTRYGYAVSAGANQLRASERLFEGE